MESPSDSTVESSPTFSPNKDSALILSEMKKRLDEFTWENQALRKAISSSGPSIQFGVGRRRILDQIAENKPLKEILSAIVAYVEDQNSEMACSILLVDEENQCLRHGASISLPESYNDAIEGIEIGDFSEFARDRSVRIQFAVGFYDDEEKVRRDTLNRYLDEIADVIVPEQGLVFESGAILVPEGDKGWSRTKSRTDFASLAHFTISFNSDQVESPFEKVRSIRRLIGEIAFDSKYAKIFFGQANLVNSRQDDELPDVDLNTFISGIEISGGNMHLKSRANVPAFLVKKADSVKLTLSAEFRSSNKEEATTDLNTFLDILRSKSDSSSDIKFIPHVANVTHTISTNSFADETEKFQANANVTILVSLDEQINPRARVMELKRFIIAQDITQKALNLRFSSSRLVMDNPDEHRVEILKKIASDIQIVDDTLGKDFQVELSLDAGQVRVWQHSDTEIQLWLPYSYNVVSKRTRDLEDLKQTRAHEIAMKDTRPQIVCCEIRKDDNR